MTELDLDAIEAREQAATKGPWNVGGPLLVAGVTFDDSRRHVAWDQATHCAYCHLGPPEWTQPRNINGAMMPAHGHRQAPELDHTITTDDGEYIAGDYDHDQGGIVRPEDTVFVAHARTDVPALFAEVKHLRATLTRVRELAVMGGQDPILVRQWIVIEIDQPRKELT